MPSQSDALARSKKAAKVTAKRVDVRGMQPIAAFVKWTWRMK